MTIFKFTELTLESAHAIEFTSPNDNSITNRDNLKKKLGEIVEDNDVGADLNISNFN